MDTIVFGNLTWEVKNLVAHTADRVLVKPSGERSGEQSGKRSTDKHTVRAAALAFYVALTQLVPCEPCRKFYLTCWCIHPPAVQSTFTDWVYDVHAIVSSKIKVTKNNLMSPKECLAPILSRQELDRRMTVLGRGSNISTWAILDFLLMLAHGCCRRPMEWKRVQAWFVMARALRLILSTVPEFRRLCDAVSRFDTPPTAPTHPITPWDAAVAMYTAARKAEGLPCDSGHALKKRMDGGCGALHKWLRGRH